MDRRSKVRTLIVVEVVAALVLLGVLGNALKEKGQKEGLLSISVSTALFF